MADYRGYGPDRLFGGDRGYRQARASRPNPALRASDADREQVVDRLKTAFSEGRLSQDEYNARMGQAYSARTYGDLGGLTADLPSSVPVTYQPATTSGLAMASLICGLFGCAVPAVILGHIAHRRIRETGQRGAAMATAGLILGWVMIVFVALLIVGAVLVGAHSGQGAAVAPGNLNPGGTFHGAPVSHFQLNAGNARHG